jgi:4-amino-4-deoxy-L-arabinose transferase-like glycosyltransferase
MNKVRLAWVVVGAGMLARLAWALLAPPAVLESADDYRALAHAVAGGHGYASAAGPTAYWMPGWPAWIAAVYRLGAGDRGVALVSVALAGATVAATYFLAHEVASPAAARVAAAACALTPSLVLLPGVLVSENLALPLVAVATLALVRAARTRAPASFALFGAAAAAATYVRQACGALALAGLVVACAAGTPRARASSCAAVALAFALVLAPWALRNRSAVGAATLTTSAGVNLCIGLGEGATGGYRQLGGALGDARGEVARQARGLRCAARGLADHPLELVTLAPAKLSRLFAFDDWIVDDFCAPALGSRARRALGALCDLGYWALLAAAATAAWRERRRDAPILAVLLAVGLSVIVGFGAGRFHAPLLPLLAVLAAPHKCYRRDS